MKWLDVLEVRCVKELTNESKDVSDVGNADDKDVYYDEEAYGDDDVASPLERLIRKQQLLHGSADLCKKEESLIESYSTWKLQPQSQNKVGYWALKKLDRSSPL